MISKMSSYCVRISLIPWPGCRPAGPGEAPDGPLESGRGGSFEEEDGNSVEIDS